MSEETEVTSKAAATSPSAAAADKSEVVGAKSAITGKGIAAPKSADKKPTGELWMPTAIRMEPNLATKKNGIAFDKGYPRRQVLHTTENKTWSPTSKFFGGADNQFWPHATLGYKAGKENVGKPPLIWQHIPINRASYALKSGGRQGVIQVEITWKAAASPDMPQDLQYKVAEWIYWVAVATGETSLAVPKDAQGNALDIWYGESDANSANAISRMSESEWKSFDGVCGHQHVPGNSHWDPGQLNIKELLVKVSNMTGVGIDA